MRKDLLIVLAVALLSACASSDDGEPERTVVGGTLSDEQSYEVPAAEAWKAVEAALEGSEFTVERRRRDDCGGKIVARREDGHRVTVTIHAPERKAAEIAVYVEPADQALVHAVQERIGAKLSLKKARSDLFGETSLEASYEIGLEAAVTVVLRACRALAFEVVVQQREKERARIEVRDRNSPPVRFTLQQGEADPSETRIVIATEKTPEGGEKDLLRRVRREVERHLFPASE